MSKIDKIKEHVGALKVYLGVLVSMIIAMGAGAAKLYIDNSNGLLMWMSVAGIVLFSIAFIFIAKYMHKKIDELEDL